MHFVQLNIYPADKQREGVRYSPVWHDPQGSLSFLKKDLAEKVGQSGRPVVLMSHCGFDTDWWAPADWKDLYDAVKDYNIVLYLYGHSGTGVRDWAPEGENKKWTCINDGQTENGFFVIQLLGDRLRAAYRVKANVKVTKNPDRTETRQWGGEWEWKWLRGQATHFSENRENANACGCPWRLLAAPAPSRSNGSASTCGRRKAPVSPTLYGIFMEEISHGFDGGIYAELIQNRSFEEGVLPPGMKLVKKPDGGLKMELEKLPPGVPKEKWDMPWPWMMNCGWDENRALSAGRCKTTAGPRAR